MARYKLEIVRPECISCELCTTICPDMFEMAADGWSTLKKGTRNGDNDEQGLDEVGCAREAADSCPGSCIHIYEEGKMLV